MFICTPDQEAADQARKMIEGIVKEIEVGEVYLGKVVSIMPFGAFVELLPGKDGMVHISKLARERVEKVEDVVNIGDDILVKVIEIDDKTYQFRIIKPELWIGMDGIVQQDNILIASPERAFLDFVYLSAGNCYFDNLHPLNKTKIKQLLPHYQSKVLTQRVAELLNLK